MGVSRRVQHPCFQDALPAGPLHLRRNLVKNEVVTYPKPDLVDLNWFSAHPIHAFGGQTTSAVVKLLGFNAMVRASYFGWSEPQFAMCVATIFVTDIQESEMCC